MSVTTVTYMQCARAQRGTGGQTDPKRQDRGAILKFFFDFFRARVYNIGPEVCGLVRSMFCVVGCSRKRLIVPGCIVCYIL